MKGVTDFGGLQNALLTSGRMFAIATLLTLVNSVSGTPYISGGDSPAGTDCSGLVSWVTNAATGRPVYGDRFNTGNIESALRARGFQYGTQPGALVVGWNGGHTAATLPDGTPVSSGESGGVKVGGGGAYQKQFTHHMFLPMPPEQPMAPDAPVVLMAGQAPMDRRRLRRSIRSRRRRRRPPLAPPARAGAAAPAAPFAPPPPPPADPFAPPPPPSADPLAPPPPAPHAPRRACLTAAAAGR